MLKKVLILLISSLFFCVSSFASVSVDSGDRILNRVTIIDHSDKTKLDAYNTMLIFDNILNGKYHIKPFKIWSSEYSLLQSTAEVFECAVATDSDKVYMWYGGAWTETNHLYTKSSAEFDIGEVSISSITFPAFSGQFSIFRSSTTLIKCFAYAELTSTDTANQVEWDICYSSTVSGASSDREWTSIFTSSVPWLGANNIISNDFIPDITTMGENYIIAPRIVSIPSGTLPVIRIICVYERKYDQ
jgi:hypothetical protein